ncbi:hypothetical protein [Phycicoccus avicenniae]|uniref:hypothetical protein n=1 Tax=Phycicoccus avicenniae TaxID=2828860 RepID=UPI003D2899F0
MDVDETRRDREIRPGVPVQVETSDGVWADGIAASTILGKRTKGRYKREGTVQVRLLQEHQPLPFKESQVRLGDLPETTPDGRRLMKLKEAAALYSVNYELLYLAARGGDLPAVRPGHAYLVSPAEVQIFLNWRDLERRNR